MWCTVSMNYHQYYPVDVVNGPGTRCTLFVAGCEHKCRGCYNATTWRTDSGKPFDQQMEELIISDLNDKRIVRQGLSLTGGDPLHPHNLNAIMKLVRRVRQETEHKDIWLWTGYTLAELSPAQMQVVNEINTLIDGKFIQELKDPALVWRGSSNQQIHYLHPV